MKKVLIVEDDVSYNLALKKKFEFAGYDVHAFINGRDACEFVKSNDVDVVLLDYELPDITGLKVAAMIKARPSLRDTPIIVISAHPVFEKIDEAAAEGIWNMVFRKKSTPIDDLITQAETAASIAEVKKWIQVQ